MGKVEALEARRLLSAGELDPTFGDGDGAVTIDSPTATSEQIHFIGRQSDEKLILGGSVGDQLALYRLNADGSSDASFGTNGQTLVTVPDLFGNGSEAIAVDPGSGRIAVANAFGDSATADHGFRVLMFDADGHADETFDSDGARELPLEFGVNALAFQSNGKLIVAVGFGSTSQLIRVNTDGTIDLSFGGGGNGKAGLSQGLEEIEIAPDDRILTGEADYTSIGDGETLSAISDVEVGRLTADGELETSFAPSGFITIVHAQGEASLLPIPTVQDIVVDGDDCVVARGSSAGDALYRVERVL